MMMNFGAAEAVVGRNPSGSGRLADHFKIKLSVEILATSSREPVSLAIVGLK